MGERTLRYSWHWNLPGLPPRVWLLVSDTHSFNRSIGTDLWPFTESSDPSGGSVHQGALRTPLGTVTWCKSPFQWIKYRGFSLTRRLIRFMEEASEDGCNQAQILRHGRWLE